MRTGTVIYGLMLLLCGTVAVELASTVSSAVAGSLNQSANKIAAASQH